MNKICFILLVISMCSKSCLSQDRSLVSEPTPKKDLPMYLDQKVPGLIPEIFAPNIVSKSDRYEFGSVFSKNGKEIFIGIDTGQKSEIHYAQMIDGKWTELQNLIPSDVHSYNDPMLSNDEQRLYFISRRSLDGKRSKQDYDIWYVEREENSWSDPINAGTAINTPYDEYYISFSEEGTMYFSSNKDAAEGEGHNFDIYTSEVKNGIFQETKRLDENINSASYEADVFIAPDESYIIFCGRRKEGMGAGDLYISFKDEQGNWTSSKGMGSAINSTGHELCPFVSNDGLYFFYTSRKDIYWVSTKIFDTLR